MVDKEEYMKSVVASFINQNEETLRTHTEGLKNDLTTLIGLHFPKDESHHFFYTILVSIHIMEIVSIILSTQDITNDKELNKMVDKISKSIRNATFNYAKDILEKRTST